jgi:hypothetical protein
MGTWKRVLTDADKSTNTTNPKIVDGDAGLVTGDQVYDWVTAQGYGTGAGDITDVVAGTGLTGGASSGSATLSVSYGSGSNIISSAPNSTEGTAIDGGDKILYADTSDTNTIKRGLVSDLPFGSGTVTSVATAGTVSGITLTGGTITTTGTITLGGSISGLTTSNLSGTAGITNGQLANSSFTIGNSTISLGGTDTTLTGLTDIDLVSGAATIFDGVGSHTLTIGASTTTVAIAGNFTVTGNLTVSGTTTTIDSTTVNVADKLITLANTGSPTTTTGSGGGIQIETSGTEAEWPELIWTNGGKLTGWALSNHATTASTLYPVAVMEFNSNTAPGAPQDAAGLGSFYFVENTGALYIRTA